MSLKCPFCETDKPELVSQFGSQLLFSQYRCRACGTYFEGLRDDMLAGAEPRISEGGESHDGR